MGEHLKKGDVRSFARVVRGGGEMVGDKKHPSNCVSSNRGEGEVDRGG